MVTGSGVGTPQSGPGGEERKIPPSVATSLQVLHTPLWCASLFWDLTLLYLGSACHLQILGSCGFYSVFASLFSHQKC